MKKVIIILVILLLFSLGCTSSKDDGTVMLEFTKLKQDYGIKESYSPDLGVMNDYVNDLSELRGESSMFISKLLDAEIASAQSFYYLLLAHEESLEIDFFPTLCSIQEVRNSKNYLQTKKYISLSIKKSNVAAELLATLNAGELEQLRSNQLLLVKQYKEQAESLSLDLTGICS
jgi:hypothetical protein